MEFVYYSGFIDQTNTPEEIAICKRQCTSVGALISFDIKGGEKEAFAFLDALKCIKLAV